MRWTPGGVPVLAIVLVLAVVAAAWAKASTGLDPAVTKWPSWPHHVTCGGLGFDPVIAFSGPTDAEKGSGGAEAALRRFLKEPGWGWIPKRHWRLIAKNAHWAEFVQGRLEAKMEPSWLGFGKRRGKWKWAGSGGCEPRTLRHGLPAAEWTLFPEAPPSPGSEELVVGISEIACSSGTNPLSRLQVPEVRYTEDAAFVTFWVRPRRGAQTCQGISPTRYVLKLPGPLGERTLYDGGTYPPHEVRP